MQSAGLQERSSATTTAPHSHCVLVPAARLRHSHGRPYTGLLAAVPRPGACSLSFAHTKHISYGRFWPRYNRAHYHTLRYHVCYQHVHFLLACMALGEACQQLWCNAYGVHRSLSSFEVTSTTQALFPALRISSQFKFSGH